MNNSREIEIRKKIDAYIKGQLTEAEVQELWNEFAKNPELLDILEIEVGVKTIIENNALNSKPKSGIKSLPKWTWHAAAAAVILIVALVQLFRVETPDTLDQFMVQSITPDQLETSDGIRAKEMVITKADSLLNLGFKAAISGNEDRAIELYDMVINNYGEEPYGSKAFLNKGILLYNEGEYEIASQSFQEALQRVEGSRMITEKAYWYLGNALINMDRLEEARDAVFKAYQQDGVFRRAAFKMIQKLNSDLGMNDFEKFDTKQLD